MKYRLHKDQKSKNGYLTELWFRKQTRLSDTLYRPFSISENANKEITFRFFYTNENISDLEISLKSIESLKHQNWIVLVEGKTLPKYFIMEYPYIETKRSFKTDTTSIIPIKIGEKISDTIVEEHLSYSNLLWSEK